MGSQYPKSGTFNREKSHFFHQNERVDAKRQKNVTIKAIVGVNMTVRFVASGDECMEVR